MSTLDERMPAADAGTVTLGASYEVRRMGYGAMRLTGPGIWGEPVDRRAATRVLRRAVELGVDFIDTADAYGPEVNEVLIAEALSPYPAGLVVGTKGGLLRDGPGQWRKCGRPDHLKAAAEHSLRRLGLDALPLYQLHSPDRAVPFEESVGALAELRAEGKVVEVGLSNVSVDQLALARQIVPIASVQNRYNVQDRGSDNMVNACDAAGVAFIPWFPLDAGAVSEETLEEVDGIVARTGASRAQIALAWLLARSPNMLVIPGTSSIEHLEENVAAAGVRITEVELKSLM